MEISLQNDHEWMVTRLSNVSFFGDIFSVLRGFLQRLDIGWQLTTQARAGPSSWPVRSKSPSKIVTRSNDAIEQNEFKYNTPGARQENFKFEPNDLRLKFCHLTNKGINKTF